MPKSYSEDIRKNSIENKEINDVFELVIYDMLKENIDVYVKSLIILGVDDNFKGLYDIYEFMKSPKKTQKEKENMGKKYNNFTFTANNPLIGFNSRHVGGIPNGGQKSNYASKKLSLSEAQILIYNLVREELNKKYNFLLQENYKNECDVNKYTW